MEVIDNEENILDTEKGNADFEDVIEVNEKVFTGFTYESQDKETIVIDTENNVAYVYYTRNSYTFDLGGMFKSYGVVEFKETIAPFTVPVGKLIGGINASLVMDIPVMLAVMAILTIPAILKNKLFKAQGYALLAIYATFVTLQFVL